MIFKLSGAVTVSAYTEVEADSLEEAIEIANDREAVLHFNGSGTYIEEQWLVDDIDGLVTDIQEL